MLTYEDARERFLDRAPLAPRTKAIYAQATQHFIDYAQEHKLSALVDLGRQPEDVGALEQFAIWLLNDCEDVTAASTAKLYASGAARWFRWMLDFDLLPETFSFDKARRLLSEALGNSLFRTADRPPTPPDGIEEILTYYDHVQMPDRLTGKDARARWLVETARNRALMRVLGETGGRVSEVVSLNADDFPPRAFQKNGVWRVRVRGKGGHEYELRFLASLPYIQTYLLAREKLGHGDYPALFIRHTPGALRKPANRIDRRDVWRIVNRAAEALGLGRVRVHDFRHWCATELARQGVQMAIIKDYLGHRSIQTTERYYAHISDGQIDEAARRVGLG